MPRTRTDKVSHVKNLLVTRLRDGQYRPGDRFMSNRAVATRFGISYQTAHRLVNELVKEGRLVRRSAAGTYLPGRPVRRAAVQLLFHPRAQRKDSFGARLLDELTARLKRERIRWKLTWSVLDSGAELSDKHFPVIWESPHLVDRCAAEKRPALLLNDRPPSGLASVYIDSVSTDDFSGGACAAQLLRDRVRTNRNLGILSGPVRDPRSRARVDGFTSVLPAKVIAASGWYLEDGLRVCARAVEAGPAGLFCCNDRLAEAVVTHCDENGIPRPPLVGFDDAPVAERLSLTTIAIPWSELCTGAVSVIKRRLGRDPATASRQIFAPRPVIRSFG
jgi:DNA-binding transcriptional regulator YhcF (GntR family)